MRIRVKRCSQASAGTLLGICDGSKSWRWERWGTPVIREGGHEGKQDLLEERIPALIALSSPTSRNGCCIRRKSHISQEMCRRIVHGRRTVFRVGSHIALDRHQRLENRLHDILEVVIYCRLAASDICTVIRL